MATPESTAAGGPGGGMQCRPRGSHSPAAETTMTDELNPTMRSRDQQGGGETAGMDPEGLMPADTSLHDSEERAEALTTTHDQPAEGGRNEDVEPGAEMSSPDMGDESGRH